MGNIRPIPWFQGTKKYFVVRDAGLAPTRYIILQSKYLRWRNMGWNWKHITACIKSFYNISTVVNFTNSEFNKSESDIFIPLNSGNWTNFGLKKQWKPKIGAIYQKICSGLTKCGSSRFWNFEIKVCLMCVRLK